MRKLTYAMGVSLDGYVASTSGSIDWSVPDDELHGFYNEQARGVGASLNGRRLYENMAAFWPTADKEPGAPALIVDFAQVWRAMPKVVFSATLESVGWNSRLVRSTSDEDVLAEVRRLKAEDGADLEIGGATLAAPVVRAGLVDEFQLAVYPVVLGGGLPFFPLMDNWVNLRRVETREFASATLQRFAVRR